MEKVVCVTGASGFIASWLVKLLLERGYIVRGSVRDPENLAKTSHLTSLPYARERLKLFKANLTEDGSFDEVVDGCVGVFHMASPVVFDTTNPQKDIVDPAVKGTINVLKSCKRVGSVKRVILTSSTASVLYTPSRNPNAIVDESFFSDLDYCKKHKLWYHLSKTMAETKAWEFSKEHNLDLVTINPAVVIGKMLQPTMNTSSDTIFRLASGVATTYDNYFVGWVDVEDVARAHMLVYETPKSFGRYLCVERVSHYRDIVAILHSLYPNLPVPTKCSNEFSTPPSPYKISAEKLQALGLEFKPIEESIKACVDNLIEQKILKC